MRQIGLWDNEKKGRLQEGAGAGRKDVRDRHSSAGWAHQVVIPGPAHLSFHLSAYSWPGKPLHPSQRSLPGNPGCQAHFTLAPHCFWGRKRRHMERQGLAQGHETEASSPQVSQHPKKGSLRALPNSRMVHQHAHCSPAFQQPSRAPPGCHIYFWACCPGPRV